MRYILRRILPLFVALLLQSSSVYAQFAMRAPKLIQTPPRIIKLIDGNISKTTIVDFDGDSRLDYIVSVRNNEPTDAEVLGTEFWINSSLKIVKRKPIYDAPINFIWFINLDVDPVPEIVSAFGYEDGISYSIYKQDFKNMQDILLFDFNPVIDSTAEDRYYWGYPWDIIDLRAQRKGRYFKILCAFDHKIERDNEAVIPKWQSFIPVIFFIGKSTQPEVPVGEIGAKKWMTLKEMISKVNVRK